MKHRRLPDTGKPPMPKLNPIQPIIPLEGLRVVLAADGLTAITNHGLEIPIDLSLDGLHKLHQMLVEQQRKKTLPPITSVYAHCLAEWERFGKPSEMAGKIRKVPLGTSGFTTPKPPKTQIDVNDLEI